MGNLSRIQSICDANGISGFEDEVVEVIKKEAEGLGTFQEDSLRNLYLYRDSHDEQLPTVLLDAHTDEVGFMVKTIRDNGMLEFIPIGGWVTTNIPAHKVRVQTAGKGVVSGIIGSKPPHYMSESERKSTPEISSLFIDIGCTRREEVLSLGVDIASPVIPEAQCSYNEQNNLLFGKAFDCRLGCSTIIDVLEDLKDETLKVNLVAGFASQEEVGCRGAQLTARKVKPDVAICFEGSPADDTFLPPYQQQTKVGKGPMLRFIDSRMITNPRFQRFALDMAQRYGIPVQKGVRDGGATNASALHLAEQGIPTIVIGIPVRYAHTHWGVASMVDVDASIELARAILTHLDKAVIESF
ncbi:putative aminopeptidase YsdC [bioreactor metagenome]|uniref:Putative aminopeptidase YsdC n=1 Tax=bioreactor metagenome TaxID=1076179 RepID=A0A645BDF3_9ZZZZ|nr:M42 family peptidase [Sphaerochaeta sp.]